MKALVLAAIGLTLVLTSTAYAQGFGRAPVGGRMCSTGELGSCKRCCQSNNFGAVCESRCERAYKGAPAKPAARAKKKKSAD